MPAFNPESVEQHIMGWVARAGLLGSATIFSPGWCRPTTSPSEKPDNWEIKLVLALDVGEMLFCRKRLMYVMAKSLSPSSGERCPGLIEPRSHVLSK